MNRAGLRDIEYDKVTAKDRQRSLKLSEAYLKENQPDKQIRQRNEQTMRHCDIGKNNTTRDVDLETEG